MSKLNIKYNRTTEEFEFTEENLAATYCTVIACLDTTGETLEFSELECGVILKNGETVIGSKTIPAEGVTIISSNQACLDSFRCSWVPDMVIDIEVWMEQTSGRKEGKYQLTVPRPPKRYASWVWDDDLKIWDTPISYPDDGKYGFKLQIAYRWDEGTVSWVEIL
jgi:hypothetical protein|tara:strand:+ start:603 stop:1097 length:495 start_codon:yes stop_codon:yes gene_type:complete